MARKRYWKVEFSIPNGKRRVYLRGDWRIAFKRQYLVGIVINNEGDEVERKNAIGDLSTELVWISENDVIGKCIEMEMSRKYARLVAKRGEIVNCG